MTQGCLLYHEGGFRAVQFDVKAARLVVDFVPDFDWSKAHDDERGVMPPEIKTETFYPVGQIRHPSLGGPITVLASQRADYGKMNMDLGHLLGMLAENVEVCMRSRFDEKQREIDLLRDRLDACEKRESERELEEKARLVEVERLRSLLASMRGEGFA